MVAKISISVKKVKRFFLRGSIYLSLFFLILLLLSQLSFVQILIGNYIIGKLSKKTKHKIELSTVEVSWFDVVRINNFLLYDRKDDTIVFCKSFELDYHLFSLLADDVLQVQSITIDDAQLNLTKYDSLEKFTLSDFFESLKDPETNTSSKEPLHLKLAELQINNSEIVIRNYSKFQNKPRIEPSNARFFLHELELEQISICQDTISGSIIQLETIEKNSGFKVSELQTDFRLSNQYLSLDNLYLKTPYSVVRDSIEFFFSDLKDLENSIEKVSFVFFLTKTEIGYQDIRLLTGFEEVKSNITIEGLICGTIGNFNADELSIGLGERSFLTGGFSCFGLPDPKQFFLLADITKAKFEPSDIYPYLPQYKENLNTLGQVEFTGSIAGFLNNFVARGDFDTDHGKIHSDIKITIPENFSDLGYRGNLTLKELEVGNFIQNQYIQKINLNASIEGKGITPENAKFGLDALIFNSIIRGYEYDSIKASGDFATNFFSGSYEVLDPNCDLQGNANIDFGEKSEILQVDVDISEINFKPLNLSEEEFSTEGKINLDIVNMDLDMFKGSIQVDSLWLRKNDDSLLIEYLSFYVLEEDSVRKFHFEVPGVNGVATGQFQMTNILTDVPILLQEYAQQLTIIPDSIFIEEIDTDYDLRLEAELNSTSNYLDFLSSPIKLADSSLLEISIKKKERKSTLSLHFKSNTLSTESISLKHTTLEINADRHIKEGVQANFIFSSKTQNSIGVPATQDLFLEGVWSKNAINVVMKAHQPTTNSSIYLESILALHKDSIVVSILPSEIMLVGDKWYFADNNKIHLKNLETTIQNLKLSNKDKFLSVSGKHSGHTQTDIYIEGNGIALKNIAIVTDLNLSGTFNGVFNLLRENPNDSYRLTGEINAKEVTYNDFFIGNFYGSSKYNTLNNTVYINFDVEREGFREIDLIGNFFPLEKDKQLDIMIGFNQADMELLSPFVEENFSELAGQFQGNARITGTLTNPQLNGNLKIKDGAVRINYLNTPYQFNGAINFDGSSLKIENLSIEDRKGATANLTGAIHYESLEEITLDIRLASTNFEFLNTTSIDNDLFYGSAYASGIIQFLGPIDNLLIKANISTENETRFFIPLKDRVSISNADYISFKNFKQQNSTIKRKNKLQGLTLDLALEINQNAYCELIFDPIAGDIIRGRGNGDLKLKIDKEGEFSIFGKMEIVEGGYNFAPTLNGATIVTKEFTIVPGSQITWYGEPYDANVDIEATYLQRAAFADLLSAEYQQENTDPQLRIKEPVLVILNLTGKMLQPQINFDLRLDQVSSTINNQYEAKLQEIVRDDQELNRQVISLLFLKRFSPKESFFATSTNGVGSSLSTYLSNQISYLASQIDENLELEVDLATLDQEGFNNLQLRFAYAFLGGRVRVSRRGSLGKQNKSSTEENSFLNDVVGDWSVEYSITNDGKLRINVFRNTNNQRLVSDLNQGQEWGFSLRFIHSFNEFRDLLTKARNDAIANRKATDESKF